FLERVPFIWTRLNFFSKVTVRNLFRYKKRLFMTLLGVAGCTALMLAGFGLRDAISSIVPKQYGEVFKFNSMIIIDENAKEQEKQDVLKMLEENKNIEKMLNVRLKNFEAGYEGDWQKINLLIPEDAERMKAFISVHKMNGKSPMQLPEEGVIIGEKLAKVLNLNIGDNMTIKDGDFKSIEVKIAAINENYTLHYVYMTKEMYKKKFGEEPVLNCILIKLKELSQEADDKISSALVNNKTVLQMNFTRANEKSFFDMVGSLNSIVLVMILSAGALAFVVLYNLTNINITERIREIASIKVLGFYDLEVSEYVFRENIILTLINVSIGLLGGIVLNKFVLETSETDVVMFGREIYWYSYVMAAALTVAFAVLVNIVMHFKLKKISMIESLKSVE
ncbi:MAG: transporter permease, partial [Eubacterium sp.]|nr:transporter permease [Eubacterium sp.]